MTTALQADSRTRRSIFDARGRKWPVIALVVVGGALRWLVSRQDLFADELATYSIISMHGLAGVVKTVATAREISPPLVFVLSWFTTRISLSPEMVRLPALIAGIATIPLVYAVGVRSVGRRAALLGAALTTLSPFMIYYSAEARGYGVAMALVVSSTLALLIAVEHGRARWWVVYGGCVCLAAYTHYTVVFVLAVQFAWALWAYPRRRRPLVIATMTAIVLYLPWLPSLQSDLNSPTQKILDALSPFTLESVRLYLEHWSVGYPYDVPGATLKDLPGTPALILLMMSLLLGAYGMFSVRSRLWSRLAARRGRAILIMMLACATPVGAALQSSVGNHVFGTRSLAASWPFLALAVAALITAGRPGLRIVAVVLAVVAFGIGAVKTLGPTVRRPPYSKLAQFADRSGAGAVVDAAAITPGPLTNFDAEGVVPDAPVFRLNTPNQRRTVFAFGHVMPVPADVARRAVAAAGGGPIIVMATRPASPLVTQFAELLPKDYALTHVKVVDGLISLQAMVYERSRTP